MNPVQFIINRSFLCALITFSAWQSHADEVITFNPVAHESTYAKVSCLTNREVSKSLSNKYRQHYRAYLTPRQVKGLIKHESFMEIEGLVSAARLKAYGRQALAEIHKTEVSVSIRTLDNQKLSTSHFQWGSDDASALVTASETYDHFNFYHQGETDCKVKSPERSRQTCYFGTRWNSRAHADQFSHILARRYYKSRPSYLIVDIFFRHYVHVDCSGQRSQALVKGVNAKPKLILRDF